MTHVATVLYEDSRGNNKSFPLHDLLLALVADRAEVDAWSLKPKVYANPRNGVNNVLNDVRRTARVAGSGVLAIVVDRDEIARALSLPGTATEDQVIAAIRERSDAADKLWIHFLYPNLEGLMTSIAECDPARVVPPRKSHLERDLFLRRAVKSGTGGLRDCLSGRQPSFAALAWRLADHMRTLGT